MNGISDIRPQTFDGFVGQAKAKAVLEILCRSAKKQNKAVSHLLLSGPPGLGKTTLARIISNEMGGNLIELVASNMQQPEQLTNILAGLAEGDVLFIDEIHTLPRQVEELLYSAMEEAPEIPIMQQGFNDLLKNIGMAKQKPVRINIKLPGYTLIGATTLQGLVSAPLRSRFMQTLVLDPYSVSDLAEIVTNASTKMSFKVSQKIAVEIARRSRATARIAIGHLKWFHEYCTATGMRPNMQAIEEAFELKNIDGNGLSKMDRDYLKLLIDADGVVGLSTLSVSLNEDAKTIEDTIEPFLLREGYVRKTAKGRSAEQRAHDLFSTGRKLKVA